MWCRDEDLCRTPSLKTKPPIKAREGYMHFKFSNLFSGSSTVRDKHHIFNKMCMGGGVIPARFRIKLPVKAKERIIERAGKESLSARVWQYS